MKRIFTLFPLLFLTILQVYGQNCTYGNVSVSPSPPCTGQPITITVRDIQLGGCTRDATLSATLNGARIDVTINYQTDPGPFCPQDIFTETRSYTSQNPVPANTYSVYVCNQFEGTFTVSSNCGGGGGDGGGGNGGNVNCSAAISIDCDQTYSRSTNNSGNNVVHSDLGSCNNGINSSLNPFTGNDQIFRITTPSDATQLSFRLTGLSRDLDMFLFRSCNGNSFGSCLNSSTESNNANESITINNPSGTYFLLVDGYNAQQNSVFDLRVDCTRSGGGNNGSLCGGGSGTDGDGSVIFNYVDEQTLRCGDRISGNNFSTGNDYTGYDCFSGGTFAGNDVFYRLEVDQPTDLCIRLTGLTGNNDLDLFLIRCNGSTTNCVASSTLPGSSGAALNSNEEINITNASGTYYIMVDAQFSSSRSNFQLEIDCDKRELSCNDAERIDCGQTVTRSNFSSGNNAEYSDLGSCQSGINPSQNPFTGNDLLFEINVPTTTTLRIDMTNLSADLDMFLFRGCQNNNEGSPLVNCVESSHNSNNSNESITLNNAFGTYYLLVDGYNAQQTTTFRLAVECAAGCDAPVCEQIDSNCDFINHQFNGDQNSNTLRYTFNPQSLPSSAEFCRWEIFNGILTNGNPLHTSENSNLNFTFNSAGTYTVCMYYYDPFDNCVKRCCRTIRVENPYDCDNIIYNYQQNNQRYQLSLTDGAAEDITWIDDQTGATLGTNATVIIPPSSTCRDLFVSVRYFDRSTNTWRICCKVIYICPPVDCEQVIDYTYNGSTIALSLNAPNVDQSSIEWIDDDDNFRVFATNTTTAVPFPVLPSPCVERWITVRYYDRVARRWYLCCRRIFFCNPFDCNDVITPFFNENTGNYQLSLGNTNFDTNAGIEWINDNTNTTIGNGTSIVVPIPSPCQQVPISVRYYDPISRCWRICCRLVDLCPPDNCDDRPICNNIDFNCNFIDHAFTGNQNSNNLSYRFSTVGLPSGAELCRWEVFNGSSANGSSLQTSSNSSFNYVFAQGGTYTVCLYYYDPFTNCIKRCCRTIFVENPYDCNQILVSYDNDQQGNSFGLSIEGNVESVTWIDDENNSSLGQGTNIFIPTPPTCRERFISVRFFDRNTNTWRICCKVIWVCPPRDCEDVILYRYNGSTIELELNAPNAEQTSVEWIDDDDNFRVFARNTTTAVPFPVIPNPCVERWITVRYYDRVERRWYYCCRRIFFCNPFDCNDVITPFFNEGGNNFNLTLGNTNFDINEGIEWINDETNTIIGGGTSVVVPIPSPCRQVPISVRYYDPISRCWRICCRLVDLCPPNDCGDKPLCDEAFIVNECDVFDFNYQGDPNSSTLRYSFTANNLPGNAEVCRWEIYPGTATSNPIETSTNSNFNYTFAQGGTYTICLFYYDPISDCIRRCCRTIVVENPYTCDRIIYDFEQQGGRYRLSIQGDVENIQWIDDTNLQTLGTGATIFVPTPNPCRDLYVSVRFFDPIAQVWRICCKVIYLCPPVDCEQVIQYSYNGSTIELNLNAENIDPNSIQWIDDDDNYRVFATNTTTAIPFPVIPNPCFERWISVRYFDRTSGRWLLCCRRIFFCDPFDCSDVITPFLEEDGNELILTLENTSFDANAGIEWIDDETGNIIGNSTSVVIPVPSPCRRIPISVRYYDPISRCWRICCSFIDVCEPTDCGDRVTFKFGEVSGGANSTINVPITVNNFNQVSAFQFSFRIENTNVARFRSDLGLVGGAIPASQVTYQIDSDGVGSLYWFQDTNPITGVTHPDETAIFSLPVEILGGAGQNTLITFTNDPRAVEVEVQRNGTGQVVQPCLLDGNCEVANNFVLGGRVYRDGLNDGVKDVNMAVTGGINFNTTTDLNGNYEFTDLASIGAFTVTPNRNDAASNGISVLDLVTLKAYLNGQRPLNEYKLIAADVNKSNSISVVDLSNLKRVLNGQISSFPNNSSWRFVPADHVFANPSDPFSATFPEARTYQSLNLNVAADDFIAIKVGDLNDSAIPLQTENVGKSRSNPNFMIPDYEVAQQQIVEVDVTASLFKDIVGCQFSITWDSTTLEFMEVMSENSALAFVDESVFNVTESSSGRIGFNWFENSSNIDGESVADDATLFKLRFMAIGEVGTTTVRFDSIPSAVEVADIDFNLVSPTFTAGTITIGETPAMSVNYSANELKCAADENGTIVLSIENGSGNYDVQWSHDVTQTNLSSNTIILTGLSAGGYSATITDNGTGGTFTTPELEIVAPAALEMTAVEQTELLCNGDTDASITIAVSGGTPDYTYVWNDGQATATATELGAGNYNVVALDANECATELNFVIEEPTPLHVSINTIDASFGNILGKATLSVNGGVPPYIYQWSHDIDLQTAEATDLAGGDYEVSITDANDCMHITTFTIQQTVNTVSLFDASELRLYPNPASQFLQIELLNQNTNVTIDNVAIYNVTGQLVQQFQVEDQMTNQLRLDLNVPDNLYLAKIMIGEQAIYRRFVVQRR